MKLEKPTQSKQMPDGVYLGKLESVRETVSKHNAAKQLELKFVLNTRDRTLIWVNQSAKGIEMLLRAGIADEDPNTGEIEIKEINYLAGVIVQNGKGMVLPATTVVKMNPALSPIFTEVSKKYPSK